MQKQIVFRKSGPLMGKSCREIPVTKRRFRYYITH